MTVYEHEDLKVDLTKSNKERLYRNGLLMFMGDGYKAITMLIRNAKDPRPVKERFQAQLEMREKPKFQKNDMESLKKEAYLEEEKRKAEAEKNKRKKVIRRHGR